MRWALWAVLVGVALALATVFPGRSSEPPAQRSPMVEPTPTPRAVIWVLVGGGAILALSLGGTILLQRRLIERTREMVLLNTRLQNEIGERTRAEGDAVLAMQRLRDGIESIPGGFVLFDADDRLVMCNSRYREALAPASERFVPGTPFEDVIRLIAESGRYADTPAIGIDEHVRRRVAIYRQNKERGEGTEVHQLSDGRWIENHEYRTREGGMVLIRTDITARKKSESELRESQQVLRAVIDSVPALINAKDRTLRYVFLNKYQAELYGTTPDEAVGKTGPEVMGSSYHAMIEAAERGVLATGRPKINYEDRQRDAAGNEHVFLKTKVTIHDDNGVPTYVVTVALDITDRKRWEEALIKAKEDAELANRAKSQFLANVSHELRTPLNSIIGFSEMMKMEKLGEIQSPRHKEYIDDIYHSGLHLLEVVNDILDLAKIEAGETNANPREVDIAATVGSCLRMLNERAKAKNIQIDLRSAHGFPRLLADPQHIRQIVVNLLSNAVKFTPDKGRVAIELLLDNHQGIVVKIADTGIGIASHDIPKVFQPFYQVADSLTRNHEGTGLGLYLCKTLAERNGATLAIDSNLGKGTTVTLRFAPDRTAAKPSA